MAWRQSCPCRSSLSSPLPEKRNGSLLGRCFSLIGLAASSLLLVLVPKCPLCLAGHLALWTGIGLSYTEAKYMRYLWIILLVGMIGFLLFQLSGLVRRMLSRFG